MSAFYNIEHHDSNSEKEQSNRSESAKIPKNEEQKVVYDYDAHDSEIAMHQKYQASAVIKNGAAYELLSQFKSLSC